MKKFITLCAAVFVAAGSFLASAQQIQQLPNDPAVRKGTLDNGLTYYIRHNELPAQRAEFYLATNVGAIQETPDQDGLAHFLEHMCFNGTKNFPGKSILNWLQSIGASFGGNVNAQTGIDQTTYMLNNIPLVRESVIDTCLLIMHDYSHFVTNDSEEIDKERPVIIEERRSRRNAQWRTFEKSLPYMYGDSKYATCTLIGSEENLKTFKRESIVNFYETWCRPDLQAIIVVGDVDPDYVEAKIRSTWADVPAPVNPKAKEKFTLTDFEEPRVAILTDPETQTSSVEILWESEARDEALNSTNVGFSMDMLHVIIDRIMDERFNDITSKADAPYLGGQFGFGKLCEAYEGVLAAVTLKSDDIMGGFQSFVNEIEKMKRYGFTEAEVQRAKDNILSSYEKAANQASTRKNPELVNPLIQNFFDNDPYMEPSTRLEIVKSFLGQISTQIINQVIAQSIPNKNMVVIYSGPEKEGIKTPTKEQLLGAIEASKTAEIAAPVEEATNVELMDASKLKGSKIKKESPSIYGATEWKLKNGVQVVVLPTEYKKDQILFSLQKDGGLSLVSDEDLASFDANIISSFKQNQGVSKFKGTELSKVLAGKNFSAEAYIDKLYSGISGSSTVKDLETAFQLLYLEYTDPRFDQEEWDNAIMTLKQILPNMDKNPKFAFQKEMSKTLYGEGPRNEFITMEKLDKASLQTVEKNYRRLFADVKGARLVITGDVDLETLKPLVEKYIGSLPAGKKATSWKNVGPSLVKGDVENTFTTDMQTPLSTVLQVYTVYEPYTIKDDILNNAVSYILQMIYTDTLREDEGGTYGASVSGSASRVPDGMRLLQVVFNSKPEKTDKLVEMAKDGFRKLAEEGPTDEQMTRTIENFKKNIPESRISNSYWLGCISSYLKFGHDNDKEQEDALPALTKENIKAAAKALYESSNFISIIQKPGQTSENE